MISIYKNHNILDSTYIVNEVKTINIHLRDKSLWDATENAYIRGNIFLDDKLLNSSEISQLISSQKILNDLMILLKRFNGFFAIIYQNKEALYVVADHVRSIPLFYGSDDNEIYISDDPQWIKREIKDNDIDELSAAEFLLTGFVTGKDTLYPHMKQLNAGEMLYVRDDHKEFKLDLLRYYSYNPGNYFIKNKKDLVADLDLVLLEVFKRLIKWANGRTIVIPLSGGYDSRLVALMLKRLGYKNLIAYSYGKSGNRESEISKILADSLSIRWEFVPYSNDAWYHWYRSEEWKNYCQISCGLSSIPHLQDWPAVGELKKQSLIPEDSVFVQGGGVMDLGTNFYKMDTEAYYTLKLEQIAPNTSSEKVMNKNDFTQLILNKRYRLWNWSEQKNIWGPKFEEKLNSTIDVSCSAENVVNAFDRWDWKELEAKFYVNSVRVYEFWGYKWWLPLWDSEFIDFWCRLPIADRLGKSLYKKYVNNLSIKIINRDLKVESDERSWIKFKLLQSPLINCMRKIYRPYKKAKLNKDYERHHFAWYGILPKEEFTEIYTGKESINSFLALKILDDLAPNSEIIRFNHR